MKCFRKRFSLLLAWALSCSAAAQQGTTPSRPGAAANRPASGGITFLTYTQARPELEHFKTELPTSLQGKPAARMAELWPKWVRAQDAAVRSRLAQGDLDSVINLLLYGTSFTQQPRVTAQFFEELDKTFTRQGAAAGQAMFDGVVGGRMEDLIAALRAGSNERLDFARNVLSRNGYSWSGEAEQQRLKAFLTMNLKRVRDEYDEYAAKLREARATGDSERERQVRAQLFASRGISLDTSWLPNLALENALRRLRDSGQLKNVARVAIVGPGLDYVDKAEGYDVYPVQTLQPFAVEESLLALGMSTIDGLEITTLDISGRVNSHILRARNAAAAGKGYELHLLLDPNVPWEAQTLAYWQGFGTKIGSHASEQELEQGGRKLRMKTVVVPAAAVLHITPRDLNIIYARQTLPPGERFDLVLGTNIFVYYSGFEQSLAEVNAAAMLREGGVLLSNDYLPELPATGLEPLEETPTRYSARSAAHGDDIYAYRKMPQSRPSGATAPSAGRPH